MGNFKIPLLNQSVPGIVLVGLGLAAVFLVTQSQKHSVPVVTSTPPVLGGEEMSLTPANINLSGGELTNKVRRDWRIPNKAMYTSRAYSGTGGATTTNPAMEAAVKALEESILRLITQNAENISVVLSNLETLRTEISTYRGKLMLLIQQRDLRVITPAQVQEYLNSIVKEVTTKLQIKLKTATTGVPDYYNDYYTQYQNYVKQLQEQYYKYYQPAIQYYPNQQYNYYQPYQYQYPSPYGNQGYGMGYGNMGGYGGSSGYGDSYGWGGYGQPSYPSAGNPYYGGYNPGYGGGGYMSIGQPNAGNGYSYW